MKKSYAKNAACTIICSNYVPYARCLKESYIKNNPNSEFYLLLLDGDKNDIALLKEEFNLITPDDLEIKEFNQMAFYYNILELSTNVKPSFLKHLFTEKHIDKLIYFDPDIYIYNSVDSIYRLLNEYQIIVTPHITQPINDNKKLNEQHFLFAGIFNLGFLALGQGPETKSFLDWWESRCLSMGFNEARNGYFVDQKWVNYLSCYYASSYVLRNPGYNMAYWNIHYRSLAKVNNKWQVNGKYPLIFYHFSGIEHNNLDIISKYQNRYDLNNRPDLRDLFYEYCERLKYHGISVDSVKKYRYEFYSNGNVISELARKLYWNNRNNIEFTNPFDAEGEFYRWMHKINANGACKQYEKVDSTNVNRKDVKIKIVNKLFKRILLIFGIEKYMFLFKYISYLGIIRNQKEIFEYKNK